jgi:DUF4097 and DUF4098 domain-containing protein YvlB
MFAAAGVLVWSMALARAETAENLKKSFTVKPHGQLVVEVDFGAIEVTTHASDQVSIHVVRRVSRGTKADEEAFLQDRPVTLSQEGDTVTVHSKAGTKNVWSWKGRQRVDGKYTIALPAQFNVRLKTSGGGIEVRDVQGEVKVNTSGGGIDVSGGGGSLNGHTSGGSIAVKSFRGPVRVDTSGGGIRVEGVAGKVEGSTSGGSISASLPSLSESVKLTTSGGSVTLRVPADAAFDLDASTSGGGASSEMPVTITGKKSKSHLKGQVNGGGKSVVLRSSGGSVRVKKI